MSNDRIDQGVKRLRQGYGTEFLTDEYRPGREPLRYDYHNSGANLGCPMLAVEDEGALQLLTEAWCPDATKRFQIECRALEQFNTRPVPTCR